jgi:hypothetical protein
VGGRKPDHVTRYSGRNAGRLQRASIYRQERASFDDLRRIAPRHRVLKSGQIILGKRAFAVIDCTVRNLSSTGAAIWLPNAAALPPKFDLLFDNVIRHCFVVWRQADLMGVKFRSESGHKRPRGEAPAAAVPVPAGAGSLDCPTRGSLGSSSARLRAPSMAMLR